MCFGGEKGKDSCKGDSGGPLIYPKFNNNPPYYLVSSIIRYML